MLKVDGRTWGSLDSTDEKTAQSESDHPFVVLNCRPFLTMLAAKIKNLPARVLYPVACSKTYENAWMT